MKRIFKITFPENSLYESVEWRERFDCSWPCFANHHVVWVDVNKLVELAERDPNSSFLPHVSQWSDDKREHHLKKAESNETVGYLDTPFVTFFTQVSTIKRYWFFKKRIITRSVGFVDGRHRVRIAQFLGATRIPVITQASSKSDLERYCS